MLIRWLGHACFQLTSAETVLVTDPFDTHVGYPLPAVRADIVTVSHAHGDHNHVEAILGQPTVLREPGEYELGPVRVRGVATFHDDAKGARRGRNIAFVIEAEGLRIVHMGDIGHMPDAAQRALLGRPDVLLLPVGGLYTVDAAEALRIRDALDARLTIPMHVRNAYCRFPIADEAEFLRLTGGAHAPEDTLRVDSASLASLPAVLALRPSPVASL